MSYRRSGGAQTKIEWSAAWRRRTNVCRQSTGGRIEPRRSTRDRATTLGSSRKTISAASSIAPASSDIPTCTAARRRRSPRGSLKRSSAMTGSWKGSAIAVRYAQARSRTRSASISRVVGAALETSFFKLGGLDRCVDCQEILWLGMECVCNESGDVFSRPPFDDMFAEESSDSDLLRA